MEKKSNKNLNFSEEKADDTGSVEYRVKVPHKHKMPPLLFKKEVKPQIKQKY